MEKSSASVGQLLGVFRQLCGLLWLLHCRDQASLYLHKTKPSVLLKTVSPGNSIQGRFIIAVNIFLMFAARYWQSYTSSNLDKQTASIFRVSLSDRQRRHRTHGAILPVRATQQPLPG